MDHCYYCGKQASLVCDYRGPRTKWNSCDRAVCMDHCVPEFKDGDVTAWTLCKEHASAQRVEGETIQEWNAREEMEAKR